MHILPTEYIAGTVKCLKPISFTYLLQSRSFGVQERVEAQAHLLGCDHSDRRQIPGYTKNISVCKIPIVYSRGGVGGDGDGGGGGGGGGDVNRNVPYGSHSMAEHNIPSCMKEITFLSYV